MSDAPESNELNVAHLARLAQLVLDDAETARVTGDLHNIIHMIDAMQDFDTRDVHPMSHPLDATARLRPDEVTEAVDRDHFQAHAPAVSDGYYLVPRVVE